jgi:hypothetical protein
VLTPWLTVLGKNVEGMPLLEVQLRRAGDELKGAKAWVSSGSQHIGCLGLGMLQLCSANSECL